VRYGGGLEESWTNRNFILLFTMRCVMLTKTVSVNPLNRKNVQRQYIDHTIEHMDFLSVREALWNYLNADKGKYSDRLLEAEINDRAPEIFQDTTGSLKTFRSIKQENEEINA